MRIARAVGLLTIVATVSACNPSSVEAGDTELSTKEDGKHEIVVKGHAGPKSNLTIRVGFGEETKEVIEAGTEFRKVFTSDDPSPSVWVSVDAVNWQPGDPNSMCAIYVDKKLKEQTENAVMALCTL